MIMEKLTLEKANGITVEKVKQINEDILNTDFLPVRYLSKIKTITEYFMVHEPNNIPLPPFMKLRRIENMLAIKPNTLYLTPKRQLVVYEKHNSHGLVLFNPIYPCYHKDFKILEKFPYLYEVII